MKQLSLNVFARQGIGRTASRRIRSQGRVPAVLYGKHVEPTPLTVNAPDFFRLLKEIGDSAAIVEIKNEGGENSLSIIREVQRDPLTDRFLHVDLQAISEDETLEVEVPVHVVGEPFGVKNENGVLDIASHEVRIRCLPRDLPEYIEINVTGLKVGDNVQVSELPTLPGVEYLDDEDQTVVACVEATQEEAAPEPVPEAAVAPAADAAGTAPAPASEPEKKAPEKK